VTLVCLEIDLLRLVIILLYLLTYLLCIQKVYVEQLISVYVANNKQEALLLQSDDTILLSRNLATMKHLI